MKINKKLDISANGYTETLFALLKKHIDTIKTEDEFNEFVKCASGCLSGCNEYINTMRFTDKFNLIHRHQG